jgi:S1-C subfamily serine protease
LKTSKVDAILSTQIGSGAVAAGYPSLYFDSPKTSKPTAEGAAMAAEFALQLLKETERNRTPLSNGKQRAMPAAVIGGGDPTSGRRVRLGTMPNYNDSGPGMLLDGVSEGSPAARAGLQPGDRILEWNGRKIDGVEDFSEVLTTALPYVQATLKVSRNGKELTLKIFPEPI